MQADDQWLIRHQPWAGMAAESPRLAELLQGEAEEHVIDSYSPPRGAGSGARSLRRRCSPLPQVIRRRRSSVCCRGVRRPPSAA
ncbi:hypothetical protein [Klebsiella quasipneumoniae]|uniref:hypothetical protein n=1 Tax=Klebsiella quasipneumoniae TaxID=1463165 RepID=UPI0038907A21